MQMGFIGPLITQLPTAPGLWQWILLQHYTPATHLTTLHRLTQSFHVSICVFFSRAAVTVCVPDILQSQSGLVCPPGGVSGGLLGLAGPLCCSCFPHLFCFTVPFQKEDTCGSGWYCWTVHLSLHICQLWNSRVQCMSLSWLTDWPCVTMKGPSSPLVMLFIPTPFCFQGNQTTGPTCCLYDLSYFITLLSDCIWVKGRFPAKCTVGSQLLPLP